MPSGSAPRFGHDLGLLAVLSRVLQPTIAHLSPFLKQVVPRAEFSVPATVPEGGAPALFKKLKTARGRQAIEFCHSDFTTEHKVHDSGKWLQAYGGLPKTQQREQADDTFNAFVRDHRVAMATKCITDVQKTVGEATQGGSASASSALVLSSRPRPAASEAASLGEAASEAPSKKEARASLLSALQGKRKPSVT